MDYSDNSAKAEIGNLPIDPYAEPKTAAAPAVSGSDEQKFFDAAGRQYALQHQQQNLGVLGRFFGAAMQAPANIAGVVCLGSLLLLLVTCFLPTNPDMSDIRKTLGTITMSALSFLFGAASSKR